jgi:hypothetical protein
VSEKKPEVVYFPAVRNFCPVCGKVSYSLSGEHPQCAMKRADNVAKARETKKQARRPASPSANRAATIPARAANSRA